MVSTMRVIVLLPGLISCYTLRGPPVAERGSSRLVARLGEEVKLRCPIQGHPQPIISWAKDGDIIDYTWPRFRSSKKSLKIRGSRSEDTGVYVCKGINGFGKVQVRIDVIIVENSQYSEVPPAAAAPVFTKETRSSSKLVSRRPGAGLTLRCAALGQPQPRLTWYKDGARYREAGRGVARGVASLNFTRLEAKDSGVYSCVAHNKMGSASLSWQIQVGQETEARVDILEGPANLTVEQQQAATFDCRVRSSSLPHIKWLKKLDKKSADIADNQSHVILVGQDKYRLIPTPRNVPLSQDQNAEYLSQLVIDPVLPGDSGMYICFVTTQTGSFSYKPAYLTVIEKEPTGEDSLSVLITLICMIVVVAVAMVSVSVVLLVRRHKSRQVKDAKEESKAHAKELEAKRPEGRQPAPAGSIYQEYYEHHHYEEPMAVRMGGVHQYGFLEQRHV